MSVIMDIDSPPGSWEREWDSRSHSTDEYRREIYDLRARIRDYLKKIEELEVKSAGRGSSEAQVGESGCADCESVREALRVLRDGGSEAAAQMLSALGCRGAGSAPAPESIAVTLESRKDEYGMWGDFEDKAIFSQRLKDLIADSFGWHEFASGAEKEAMHMIVHKIARLVYGNPSHVDSWRDIAGYAMLVVNLLETDTGK